MVTEVTENGCKGLQLREYVYDSEGIANGQLSQSRKTYTNEDGTFRVDQNFKALPGMKLPTMRAFRGKYSFEGERKDNLWTFNGPDVIGQGLDFGDRTIFSQGVWPKFGHHFECFAAKGDDDRELAARMLFSGPNLIAVTTGVGVPDDETSPRLDQSSRPWALNLNWEGIETEVAPDGTPRREFPVERCYEGETGYVEKAEGEEHLVAIIPRLGRDIIKNTRYFGTGKRYGNFYNFNAYGPQGELIRSLEIFDAHGKGSILTVKLVYFHGALSHSLVSHLRPRRG